MDDQEVKYKVLGNRSLKETCKKFQGDTNNECIRFIYHLILVMKLAMLDEEIKKYLLYSLLSMQYAMEKQLMLLDAFFSQTVSNEDWTQKNGL